MRTYSRPSTVDAPVTDVWHVQHAQEVSTALETATHGLTREEAARRRERFGPNRLPERGPTPWWKIALRQFVSPLIYILVAAAVISFVVGDIKDAIFIGLVLLINAVIGGYQEARAETSSHALRKMLRIHANVEREGQVFEVPAEDVVPGDIVWLESGNRVPADMRLLLAQNLEVDESLLTGESAAVSKDADWTGEMGTTLAERKNMVFAGAMVARGRAKGVVVATGTRTFVGQLAVDVMGEDDGKPPLLVRMERFTSLVAVATLASSTLIGLWGYLVWNYTLIDTFFFVTALAVSAIPEGLPVAMTVALAVATTRMSQRHVIVRRLTAVEGLGSCTLIATDKTGTLTCNELTVREIRLPDGKLYPVMGEGFAPAGEIYCDGTVARAENDPELARLVMAASLCNEADLHHHDGEWRWRGDAVDVALLTLSEKAGLHRADILETQPLIHQIAFEPEQQFAASFHRVGDKTKVYAKGAPERIDAMCHGGPDDGRRRWLERTAQSMAAEGYRVLAVADGQLPHVSSAEELPATPCDLHLTGLIGMLDPLRPGVRQAVQQCHQAGVRVAMVTGDHRLTALSIAYDLNLVDHDNQLMTGADLEAMHDTDLVRSMENVRVFARVTPRDKLRIVRAARTAGHFVAVTGDGVNDAPALKSANIGVAMGKSGTDVAREAAELVISDDNFTSIVAGIEEGRIAYDNIRKVIYLLLSMGAAELLMVFLAVLFGLPVPLLPVQLLWLNLVTNGIQGVALAFEPDEGDVLLRPPRSPHEPVFNRLMLERMVAAVLVVGCGGFLTYYFALRWGWTVPEARNLLLLTMVLFENFHVGNCRSEVKSAFALSPLRSPMLFYGVLVAFLIHVIAMYQPLLQDLLETRPLDLQHWIIAITVSITIVPVIEWHKWQHRRVANQS